MKVFKIAAIALLFMGMLCIAGGFLIHSNTAKFLKTATSSTGSVTGFEKRLGATVEATDSGVSFHPIVEFETSSGEQITFTSNTGGDPAPHKIGESVPVLYQPANPQDARIDSFLSFWLGQLIAWGIGAVLFLVGGIFGAIAYRSHKAAQWLKLNGKQVTGSYQGVKHCTAGFENPSAAPYRILVKWHDTKNDHVHTFESPDIRYDPTPFVEGREFSILFDPNNPAKHLVDISNLPKYKREAQQKNTGQPHC